jgi:hypothetical protein
VFGISGGQFRRYSLMISSALRPFPSFSFSCLCGVWLNKVVGLLEAWVGDRAALQATTDLHTLRAAVKVSIKTADLTF